MKIYIVIPVFNDWESLDILIPMIEMELSKMSFITLSFLIVNDCSPIAAPLTFLEKFKNVQILDLQRNLGHQKAIAIGLAYLDEHKTLDAAIVMDADGEDRAEDLPLLIQKSLKDCDKIIFAQRSKRRESFWFQFFYQIYKLLFVAFTGKYISFGNFSIIPQKALSKLVYVSEIYNHFSGGVIRSKLPYTSIPIERGKRLRGESKMNFSSLVLHGLSAVSVMLDMVAVRLLLFSGGLMSCCLLGILFVLGIKYMTDMAIPGWASSVLIGLVIILMQSFLLAMLLIFIVLTERTKKTFLPARDYKDFVKV